jgi:hypothetical protein
LDRHGTLREIRSISAHGEIHATLVRCGQNVQRGVGRPTHRYIQSHGVFKRHLVGDIARQEAHIVLLIMPFGDFDDQCPARLNNC